MEQKELIPHLFRTEFSKITAVLCRRYGLENISSAEDIAGETFATALDTWPRHGIPENPVAWLYSVARHKALNYLKRDRLHADKLAGIAREAVTGPGEDEIDLSEKNIRDSQLGMLFVLCHPSLSPQYQICLSLRILCGFSIDEIASALLTSRDTVNKRLFRGKEKLRKENIKITIPPDTGILPRLDAVLTTLYLQFNEGYYSESHREVLRKELCLEAMRLTHLLIENEQTNLPQVNALMALMCFHSSRFDARKDEYGELVLYDDQDESKWDQRLISQGHYFLHQSSRGEVLTRYHIEAHIARWHTVKTATVEKWQKILELYDKLLEIAPSSVAELNRNYAYARVSGNRAAIDATEKLNLSDNPYYYALLGELYLETDRVRARNNFNKAFSLVRNPAEKNLLKKKLKNI